MGQGCFLEELDKNIQLLNIYGKIAPTTAKASISILKKEVGQYKQSNVHEVDIALLKGNF